VLCLGLAMMFVGGWYFQSSLVELKAQQQVFQFQQQAFQSSMLEFKLQKQETVQIVLQLKEKVRKQSEQINELCLQLEMREFKVSANSSSYNTK